jgi:vacuolar-type H+-ATPase subunit E/Vma4
MREGDADRLFEGILEGARAEAAAIVARARQESELISSSNRKKIDDAIEQEKRAARQRIAQIKRQEESALRNLERRHAVSHGQRLRGAALELVAVKMAALVGTDEYRETLVRWIAEAAIGLDRPEAIVNCSFREQIDADMLRSGERLVKETTGRDVSLHFGGAILTGQGIEVTSTDGKVAYNNQVSTRLVRFERHLKELMEGQACHRG